MCTSCVKCKLNSFQPSDVTIVKSMKNPPSGVKLVMAAVCVMKDLKPDKIADPAGTGQKVRPCQLNDNSMQTVSVNNVFFLLQTCRFLTTGVQARNFLET